MTGKYLYLRFRAEVSQEGDLYVGVCPELDVSSFGVTVDKAKESLREAVEAFMEGCQSLGTLEEVLQEAGFSKQGPSKAYKILRRPDTVGPPQNDIRD